MNSPTSMAFSVQRSNSVLIKPSEETPCVTLDLSAIDSMPPLRCYVPTVTVYRHGPGAAKTIMEALSRTLVHYYPFAGRLKESNTGRLQIECRGKGVRFVEASANCTLEAVSYFEDVTSVPFHDLLPDQIQDSDDKEPPVQMQVTQFECGGFVIGLLFCHAIGDGLSAAQFLNAIGELARGLKNPSVEPVWHRDFFPQPCCQANPEKAAPPPPPPRPDHRLDHANIDISPELVTQFKKTFKESTGNTCSTFEAVVASLWRARTRAIGFDPKAEIQLQFYANCRQVLDRPLPGGFYGNCFFPATIKTRSQILQEASLIDVVKLIQEAKAKLPIEFSKFVKGEHSKDGVDPFKPAQVYTTLFVSEWGRLGLNQVDYGWGCPVHIVPKPASDVLFMPVVIMGAMPLPKRGIRLMSWCVKKAHRNKFVELMDEPFMAQTMPGFRDARIDGSCNVKI